MIGSCDFHNFRFLNSSRMKTLLFLLLIWTSAYGQLAPLSVEKIMRDPKWIGVSPSSPFWSEDSKTIYFKWNPDKNAGDSLYSVLAANPLPRAVSPSERRSLPAISGVYNHARTRKLFEKNGDLFLMDLTSGKINRITNTIQWESKPFFSTDEKKVLFMTSSNLYSWDLDSGTFSQLTNFMTASHDKKTVANEDEKWLKTQQLAYFEVLKQRNEKRNLTKRIQEADRPVRPKEIFTHGAMLDEIHASGDLKFIVYSLTKSASAKTTHVPNYVTESGFTEEIPGRKKAGAAKASTELFVYDIRRDTVYSISTDSLPGRFDSPDYKKDYPKPESKDDKQSRTKPAARAVNISQIIPSPDGKYFLVIVRSEDNKDRWITLLDLTNRKLQTLYRHRDEAWIGGPGIDSNRGEGWFADSQTIWFVSEESGYAHLYTLDIHSKSKRALTSGSFEVQWVQLAHDEKSFYILTNEVHPGEKQLYRLPVSGGKAERLTSMSGAHEVVLSHDEKWLAYRYSYSNQPWELYIQENKPQAKPRRITYSQTDEFKSYPWRDPQVLTFDAKDGAKVHARLFVPANPNGAAVIFVHGAGYLQNAHRWWSHYFREYMFHNLLADKGYTVLDMDYRGSAGYGRDWRTGIYRHMGGKDLTDQVDGAKWLVDKYGINPARIGIYGGSYGGFITLMGMFTTPGVFAAGAALRPVTDWAHYDNEYTPEILNEPQRDSLSYAKSSPIYYAEGLKGHLLICHGMIDTNVHFQDAVFLAQRLIELGKDNWELAVYPVEDHGFVEPSSWTDEYKRILKLFEDNLR